MRVLALPAFRNERANPYNALLYRAMVDRGIEVTELTTRAAVSGGVDIVHVHWPEANLNKARPAPAYARSAELLAALAVARSRGAKVIWTTHNLAAHEQLRPAAERWFWRAFVPLVDGWIGLTEPAAAAARVRFPRLARLPSAVVPHGHYRDAYPPPVDRQLARAALGLDADVPVAVFLGRVKRYKQVPELVRAFAGVEGDAQLVVAGLAADPDVRAEVERAAANDPRVHLRLADIPADDVPELLAAADVVVAPYRDVLNSGSALLALSFGRPVLVPGVGSMLDLQRDAGDEWVVTYAGDLSSVVISDALARSRRPRPALPALLERLAWGPIAEHTVQLYERVRSSSE